MIIIIVSLALNFPRTLFISYCLRYQNEKEGERRKISSRTKSSTSYSYIIAPKPCKCNKRKFSHLKISSFRLKPQVFISPKKDAARVFAVYQMRHMCVGLFVCLVRLQISIAPALQLEQLYNALVLCTYGDAINELFPVPFLKRRKRKKKLQN